MTDLALSSDAMGMSRGVGQVSSEMDRLAEDLVSTPESYSDLPTVLSAARLLAAAKQGGLRGAPTAGDAMDTILADIQKHVEQQPVLVIWMVDASLSIAEDRLRMADRIERFLHFGTNGSIKDDSLQNGVVAFGQSVQEIVRPTVNGPKVADAIRSFSVDQSGVENVFTAVQWAARKYGKQRGRKILLVLWTDESGDDTSLLEETIALCRKWHISVTTVGPTAVLGMQRGYQPFTLTSGEHYKFLLPVDRGPDTALPERLMLPYWHGEKLPPWNFDGARMANRSAWYGGPFREGLLSGVGPYSLTRLSLATRGKFLILNRPGEQTRFPVEKLQDYFPEYSSREECIRAIQKSNLRAAVVAAVEDTYAASAQMYPVLAFVATRTTRYPFYVWAPYLTPVEFRLQLKRQLQGQVQLAIASSYAVDRALSRFTADGLEDEYREESSKRWRAWYDVTLGRLLANSVRLIEYRLICEALLRGEMLQAKTNYIELLPSHRFRGKPLAEIRAVEAERLLRRCVEENPETPWQYLAEWELEHGFGLEVVQQQRERPKPSRSGPRRKERNQPFSIPRL